MPEDHPATQFDADASDQAAGTHYAGKGSRVHPGWYVSLGAVALIALSLLVDQAVTSWLTADAVRRVVEKVVGLPLAAGIYLAILAILAAFPNRRRLWVGFLVPVLLSTGVLHALKWAIGRARPMAHLGAFHFEPFSGAEHCDAFPSGHATAVGTLAVLLGIYFPRGRWVFYVLAALVGVERIVHDWHFLSDVLAGYALAAAVVYACFRGMGAKFYRRDLMALRPSTGSVTAGDAENAETG